MLWIFESFPFLPVALGIATHGMYYKLLEQDFPFIELTSVNFLGSTGACVALYDITQSRCGPLTCVFCVCVCVFQCTQR